MKLDLIYLNEQRKRVMDTYHIIISAFSDMIENNNYDGVQVFGDDNNPALYVMVNGIRFEIIPNWVGYAGGFDIKHGVACISFAILPKGLDVHSIAVKERAIYELFNILVKYRHVLLHELVHKDDYDNGLIEEGTSSKGDTKEDYFNHPVEYKAYLQESLFSINRDLVYNYGKKDKYSRKQLDEFAELFIKLRKRERMTLDQFKYLTKENYIDLLDTCKEYIYSFAE